MTSEAVAPDGTRWTVRRRWLARARDETLWGRFRRRFRRTGRQVADGADAADGLLDVGGDGIVTAIALVLAVLVILFFAIPLVVAIADLLGLLLLTLLGAATRVVGWRPWTIEASADDGPSRSWRIVGWRASGEMCRRVAGAIEHGLDLPPQPPSA